MFLYAAFCRRPFWKKACYVQQHSFQKFKLPDTTKIDIWHNTYQSSLYIPKKGKLKIILTVHDLNFLYKEGKSSYQKRKYLDGIKKRIERADYIVAISKFTLNDVKQNLDIGNRPCKVIYNGCNIEEINSPKMPAINPPTPFLFTIGTILEKEFSCSSMLISA